MPSASPEAASPCPLLTREQVLRALRQIAARRPPLPPGTVYELVYRGRRYPPRAVAELAYRLATGNPAARWPRPAGLPTNALLESLDFTISTKRPVLTSGSAHDGEEAAASRPRTSIPASHEAAEAQPCHAEPPNRHRALPGALLHPRRGPGRAVYYAKPSWMPPWPAWPAAATCCCKARPAPAKPFWRAGWPGCCWARRTKAASSWCSFTPATATRILCWASGPMPKGRFRLVPGVLPLLCQRAAADPDQPVFPAD